jgi:cobaltochelatase CobS
MQPSVDLTPYALKTEVERVQAIFALAGNKAQTRMGNIEGEIQALRNLRPIEVHFPEKPTAVRIEGIAHPQFLDLLISLRAGLHCMLVGPAGSGKTYSAEQAAKALDRRFHMQGAISYAHELLGYIDAHSRYVRTQFRDAFEHGGLILLDEFDASAAEAALVLNAALANGACSFPDGLVSKHADFLCVLGANTDGSGATMQYAGRARLDGAFLDRFVVFDWQIDPRIEESLSQGNTQWLAAILAIRAFAHQRQIVDVVATPRATQRGALLASQGMDKTRILERTCKRGALVESWPEVLRLPAVASFLKS